MADLVPVRDALQGVGDAFSQAATHRLELVRALGRLPLDGADAGALHALIEALLRREAADADQRAPLRVRVARAAAEARAAGVARERLAGNAEVEALLGEVDRTWTDALARTVALADGLQGRTTPEIAVAFADYAAALTHLHDAGRADEPRELDEAADAYAAALARLERTVGLPPD